MSIIQDRKLSQGKKDNPVPELLCPKCQSPMWADLMRSPLEPRCLNPYCDANVRLKRRRAFNLDTMNTDGVTTGCIQSVEPNISNSPKKDPQKCECVNWPDLDRSVRFLTGHHANCVNGGDPLKAAKVLIGELVHAMERWAAEEDGVYRDAWHAYCRGKSVIGEFDWAEKDDQ